MQVYKGLEIVTNKITHGEEQVVRHYLLGEIEPDSDFTAEDYSLKSIIYVEQSILNRRVDTRVDEMVNADYTKGIRRSIGVPKMARYLREEKNIDGDDESKKMILQASISIISKKAIDEAWRNTVLQPCLDIVKRFLKNYDHNIIMKSKMNNFINNNNRFNKKKVMFIMGATGTGKSSLC
ncbi:hypothetical protein H5410_001632 [Solanum commersonii]|uniref:Uncharacterized protein n=1 Tax=Solanum commersonii TaxID=4109 RepID=A0A9J6B067_SOLCO|nr:hypothetical protein H5410_001632 [Solanum commersonii]